MEFRFDFRSVLTGDLVIVSADKNCGALYVENVNLLNSSIDYEIPNWTHKKPANHEPDPKWRQMQRLLFIIVDELGRFSSRAQGLRSHITDAKKLISSDHRMYILSSSHFVRPYIIGMIKVGFKTLFLHDADGNQVTENALCLLDFYVVCPFQRKGYGIFLFKQMLKAEGYSAGHIAYDVPSPRLLQFLNKHFELYRSIPQYNNFVVFHEFFIDRPSKPPITTFQHEKNMQPTYGCMRKLACEEKTGACFNLLDKWQEYKCSSAAGCLVWDNTSGSSSAASTTKFFDYHARVTVPFDLRECPLQKSIAYSDADHSFQKGTLSADVGFSPQKGASSSAAATVPHSEVPEKMDATAEGSSTGDQPQDSAAEKSCYTFDDLPGVVSPSSQKILYNMPPDENDGNTEELGSSWNLFGVKPM